MWVENNVRAALRCPPDRLGIAKPFVTDRNTEEKGTGTEDLSS
jgi:hypothetical protein